MDPPNPTELKSLQGITGELNWLSTRTRPDISYCISVLASALTKYSEFSFRLSKKILRYCSKYRAYGLHFTRDPSCGTTNIHKYGFKPSAAMRGLTVYTDASFAGFNLKSQTGILILWEANVVLWRSGRQNTTATSTSEAELTAGSLGTQIAMGLQALLEDWGQESHIALQWDNRSTLSTAHLGGTWRSRH